MTTLSDLCCQIPTILCPARSWGRPAGVQSGPLPQQRLQRRWPRERSGGGDGDIGERGRGGLCLCLCGVSVRRGFAGPYEVHEVIAVRVLVHPCEGATAVKRERVGQRLR